MKHKWYNEIVAWAGGAEIEIRTYELDEVCPTWSEWKHWSKPTDVTVNFLTNEGIEYRIKPQPVEPQYLYVYKNGYSGEPYFDFREGLNENAGTYIGKIPLILGSNDD